MNGSQSIASRQSLYEGSSSTGRGDAENDSRSPFSNQTVLSITCISFSLFVIAEVIGAISANSWSLLGDAAAMSVDVISYFTNMCAERIKSGGGAISPRMQMSLEVHIPLFSVTLLVAVTIYVTVGAIGDIVTTPTDDDVDILFLWLFSSLNAVVDIVSGYMFYSKGTDVFYEDESLERRSQLDADMSPNSKHAMVDENGIRTSNGSDPNENDVVPSPTSPATNDNGSKNLNMISAFTHVGGDTLRTLSVFIAAAVATAGSIPGYLCDAWAAVFVSITIVIMIIPLLHEIIGAHKRISARIILVDADATGLATPPTRTEGAPYSI